MTSKPGPFFRAALLTDNLNKPPLDHREYRVIRLDNGIEVLLVHDPDTDKASAALDVNVGYFSDEKDMPGVAHAVEHVLFMGTKKFPNENDYNKYLASNSGDSNAYTAATSTNYYFEVAAKPANDEDPTEENPSPLLGALDRFAQFFIEPLFLAETLDRELRAVNAEHKKNLQSDERRVFQLEKSLSNPEHPFSHFGTGNLEVLKTGPESRNIDVRSQFVEFYRKHYSANRMKLVIYGREKLDVLQKWTEQLFSPIVNQKLPQNRWEDELPFRPEDMGTQTFVKSVMDDLRLILTFQFIDEEHCYETQPSHYLCHLLGHKGPGSIMAYVKDRGWLTSLSAKVWRICPGSPSLFKIDMDLTDEGRKKYREVIKVIFQYISMVRDSPEEWIHEELELIADANFKRNQNTTAASDFTSEISNIMQGLIPREMILRGPERVQQFDPAAIKHGLEKLNPDNMRICIISSSLAGEDIQEEKWYGTEHRHEEIPDEDMSAFRDAAATPEGQRIPDLHLPQRNQFIPKDLVFKKKNISKGYIGPRLVRNDDLVRTWWREDDAFGVPEAHVTVILKTPLVAASSRNCAMASLYMDLLRDDLEVNAYDAELAGFKYDVRAGRNIVIDISGYNDKVPILLERVVSAMKNLEIKQNGFDVVKECAARSYRKWAFGPPFHQVGYYLHKLNSDRYFLVEEKAAELPNITAEDIGIFREQLLAQMYLEILCTGNMHREDALKATNVITSTFNPLALPRSQLPIVRSTVLPAGSNFVLNQTLADPGNVNHCVETWLYVGDVADRALVAKTALFGQMICEPGFDQLRTKEQLGYAVFAGAYSFDTTTGIRILIQSERKPGYLDARIESFLLKMGTIIKGMSNKEFGYQKESLIANLLGKPRNLSEEHSRYSEQIVGEYYDFRWGQHQAEVVRTVTKAEMIDFYRTYISPLSPQRARISVHLHAQGKSELDTKVRKVLEDAGLADVPLGQCQNLDMLEAYLNGVLDKSKLTSTIDGLEEVGLTRLPPSKDPSRNAWKRAAEAIRAFGRRTSGCCLRTRHWKIKGVAYVLVSIAGASEIIDVRAFHAGLAVGPGAKPLEDWSSY